MKAKLSDERRHHRANTGMRVFLKSATGVTRDMSNDEIRAAWRKLVRDNHPDRLIAQGLPEEFVMLANQKVATINAAYDKVAKERGIN